MAGMTLVGVSTQAEAGTGPAYQPVTADPHRSYVRATARTSVIDTAFQTQLDLYQSSAQVNAGAYPLRANSKAVSVPTSLTPDMLGVTAGVGDQASARRSRHAARPIITAA